MSFDKTPITEIPADFIIKNLTQYQIERIQQKFHIINIFEKKRKCSWKQIMQVYYDIGEDIGLSGERVRGIVLEMQKK